MHLGDHLAFSQIAYFDAWANKEFMETGLERLTHAVPIQGAIDLSLGLLKLPVSRFGRQYVITPNHVCPSEQIGTSREAWRTLPLSGQLHSIRYAIERLVMVSHEDVLAYSSNCLNAAEDEANFMNGIVGRPGPLPVREAIIAAYAIDSLIPWAVLPAAPQHPVDALAEIMRPLVASNNETVEVIAERLAVTSSEKAGYFSAAWKDAFAQIVYIKGIGDIRTDYFHKNSNICASYYGAMLMVFETAHLPVKVVRQTLAAVVAW